MPQRKNRAAHSFPCQVLGVVSPYPTVVSVTCEILPLDPDSVFVISRIITVKVSVAPWLITLTETSRLFWISQKPNPILFSHTLF